MFPATGNIKFCILPVLLPQYMEPLPSERHSNNQNGPMLYSDRYTSITTIISKLQ